MAKIFITTNADGSLANFASIPYVLPSVTAEVEGPLDLGKLDGYRFVDGSLIFDEDLYQSKSDKRKTEEALKVLEEIRASIDLDRLVDQAEDEDFGKLIYLYNPFQIGHAYKLGDRFRWQDDVYEVLQAHTSAEVWKPNEATSLYKKVRGDES